MSRFKRGSEFSENAYFIAAATAAVAAAAAAVAVVVTVCCCCYEPRSFSYDDSVSVVSNFTSTNNTSA